MGKQDGLTAISMVGDWNLGDSLERTGHHKTLIFRFAVDCSQQSSSLNLRIVNTHRGHEVNEPNDTLANRSLLPTAIWSAIAILWTEYKDAETINGLDVIISPKDVQILACRSRKRYVMRICPRSV